MKSVMILAFIFAAISCGKEELPPGGDIRIGQNIEVDPEDYLSDSEKNNLSNVCQALRNKISFFKQFYVNQGKVMEFKTSRRGCNEQRARIERFKTKLHQVGGELFLKTYMEHVFKDIVGPDSEMVRDFCQNSTQSGKLLRYKIHGNSGVWLHSYKGGTADCRGNKLDLCLKLSTAIKVKDKFEVKDVESIKIQMRADQNNNGVVLNRALSSSRFCTKKNTSEVLEQAFVKAQ
mgnify:CR=1 FL=1